MFACFMLVLIIVLNAFFFQTTFRPVLPRLFQAVFTQFLALFHSQSMLDARFHAIALDPRIPDALFAHLLKACMKEFFAMLDSFLDPQSAHCKKARLLCKKDRGHCPSPWGKCEFSGCDLCRSM